MTQIPFNDTDLVVVAGLSSGVALQHLLESETNPTVFVVGPTFPRETALDIPTFAAQASPETRIILPLLSETTRESYANGTVELLPVQASDQRRVVKTLASEHDRVVGIIETADPVDGTYTPGICGIGIPALVEAADLLVAERNPNAPRIPGIEIPSTDVDIELDAEYALPSVSAPTPTETANAVAENVLDVIPDGATLQLGRGNVPTAVTDALLGESGYRMHTGIVDGNAKRLIEQGVITDGSVVAPTIPDCPFDRPVMTGVVAGPGQAFYDWVENSKTVVLGGLSETHQPSVAGKNPALTAINSAVQIDLSGQVNAERIRTRQVSAPGGQPDFVRAARVSAGGRSIIALTSTVDQKDISKIVAGIPPESVVTTPRYAPDFVVTERNVVDCRTSSIRERAGELIQAAAPAYRQSLREAAVAQQLLPEKEQN